MNDIKTIKEIGIFSEFVILFNNSNDKNEIIKGWAKSESPDFIYTINDKNIGIELSELVFSKDLHSLNLTLRNIDYPDELKGYSVLVYNERNIDFSSTIIDKINAEIIKFLSEKYKLVFDTYMKKSFSDYDYLNKYVRKIVILKSQPGFFDIRHTALITSTRGFADFQKLVSEAIRKKVEKVENFISKKNHLLLYTDFQTDINNGPALEIISDYIKSLGLEDIRFTRVYLFLRWINKYYTFYLLKNSP